MAASTRPEAAPAPAPVAPRVPFRRRSRVVAWAKVLVPLAALALLSTVFLLARPPGSARTDVPFARLDEIARDPRIEAPRLSGVAEDGTTVALAADRIRPLGGDAFALDDPRLEARAPDGSTLTLAAGTGEADGPGRTLRLAGGVRVATSGGTAVRAEAARVDLGEGTLATEGGVTATGPFGELAAGGLRADRAAEGRARLVFNGGVRLLYRPPRPEPGQEAPP